VQTLTEIVAAVVLHSSAAAYSHFGVTLEAPPVEKPATASAPAERSVARTAPKTTAKPVEHLQHAADCPSRPRAHVVKT
jgi:hypothetical protein